MITKNIDILSIQKVAIFNAKRFFLHVKNENDYAGIVTCLKNHKLKAVPIFYFIENLRIFKSNITLSERIRR